MARVEAVHCYTCGKQVSGVDEELGLVVRAWVQCPECLAVEGCINCRAPFQGSAHQQVGFMAQGRTVGPFCLRCADVLQTAVALALAANGGGAHGR